MNFPLSAEQIAEILGCWFAKPPLSIGYTRQMQGLMHANVARNWPLIEAALDARGVYSEATAVAAIATVSVETNTFAPVREKGGPEYLAGLYEGRKDLGNTCVGDGARFRGRGFVQITGRWSYAHFGQEIHRDLENDPDLALVPQISAEIFAAYFHERGIPRFAETGDWKTVRRRVNGGMGGWDRFIEAVTKLNAMLEATRGADPPATPAQPESEA